MQHWEEWGEKIPLLVNLQPAGEYLGEGYFKAGGVPAVMKELLDNNKLIGDTLTVSGKSVKENLHSTVCKDRKVIYSFDNPMKDNAGFLILRSNFFDTAIMKMSVVNDEFIERYLSEPSNPNIFISKAIVFDGPEDYHKNINNSDFNIDEDS